MSHPYADLIGFEIVDQSPGESRLEVPVRRELLNPHNVVHGGVLYSLADTGMGAALYPMLDEGKACATINCAINYFRPVMSGSIACVSTVINKGRTIATLESEIWNEGKLAAMAHGQFSIFATG
ncbi:PaaI family thioesterase [Hoeflea sp. TYP-13]|uniref:PaaI family thioesterase n=1 Tax=Hoeflea sp. TYP-13 TaxID=3230023 RepID=UPI0034C63BED